MIYEFQATQSYNGYDKPWAGGTNENKLDPELFDEVSDFPVNKTIYWYTLPIILEPNTEYRIAPTSTASFGVNKYFVLFNNSTEDADADPIPENGTFTYPISLGTPQSLIFTTGPSGAIRLGNPGTVSAVDANFLSLVNSINWAITEGSSAKSFTPYTNVCMPEGFNIWDPEQQDYTPVYAGYVNSNTRELLLRPVYQEYAGEELVGPWMSSLDLYSEDATPTEGAFVIDFGGELTSLEITPFMLQTLLDSMGIRQHFTDGASLLNKLMDQAQGRVRSEEELLHLSRPLRVIAIGDQLPSGITIKPISKDVLPGLPGKFIR